MQCTEKLCLQKMQISCNKKQKVKQKHQWTYNCNYSNETFPSSHLVLSNDLVFSYCDDNLRIEQSYQLVVFDNLSFCVIFDIPFHKKLCILLLLRNWRSVSVSEIPVR